MTRYRYSVNTNKEHITAFDYIKYFSDTSTRLFNKFKLHGTVFINGAKSNLLSNVANSDIIEIELDEDTGDVLPEDKPIDVIFEDEYLLAVNKPAGLVIHPTCSHPSGTLANYVANYYLSRDLNIPVRPVIRLDKDTSGMVLFAKNAHIQESLINTMKSNNVTKVYLALVEGVPTPESAEINAPISRLPGSIITRQISANGAYAVTHYKLINKYGYYSSVEVRPETGRTHQIRVHMQYIGHPILGDTLYGKASDLINRQALHALRYEFIHPVTSNRIVIECPVPEDIKKLI